MFRDSSYPVTLVSLMKLFHRFSISMPNLCSNRGVIDLQFIFKELITMSIMYFYSSALFNLLLYNDLLPLLQSYRMLCLWGD